jgi:hypothetical protein
LSTIFSPRTRGFPSSLAADAIDSASPRLNDGGIGLDLRALEILRLRRFLFWTIFASMACSSSS